MTAEKKKEIAEQKEQEILNLKPPSSPPDIEVIRLLHCYH